MRKRERDSEESARGDGGGGGGYIDTAKQVTRIRASSKDAPRRRIISIFRGNGKYNIGKEDTGGNLTKGGVVVGGDSDNYNGKYHHRHHLYYSSTL